MRSTPNDLRAYEKGYEIRLKTNDRLIWAYCGNYVLSAVAVAVEAILAGKKAKGKYIDTPLFDNAGTENKELSEEELQKQRELFVAKLMIMKTNFDLNHKK